MSFTYINSQDKVGVAKKAFKLLSGLYFLGLLCAVLYVWFMTQDRYVTIATFKISRQDASSAIQPSLVDLALPGLSDSGSMDSQLVIAYINSADLLLDLEKQFKLIEHFSSPKRDFVFRLDPNDLLEKRLEYYRKHIVVHYDIDTGLTVVTVDTFDPALAQKIATEVLKKAEDFVNTLNQDVADQQLTFILSEVERTSEKVNKINRELLELQNKYKFISPAEVISTSLAAAQEMQMQKLHMNAELSSLMRDSPESPMIETIKSRMRSLDELIEKEKAKLSGSERDRLNRLLLDFKEIELNLEMATRLRTGAEMMLESNRTEALARSRFFSLIQIPYLPEEVALPLRTYSSITIIFLGLLCFIILRALLSSVYERA